MPESAVEPAVEPVVAPVVEPVTEGSIINSDGSFVENWSSKYGEENQAHLSRYKNVDSLVNSHIETKRKLGKDPSTLIEIPNETSSDSVKTAWRKAHNVPETKDGYKYALSDEMASKLGPLDEKKIEAFKEYADKKNWSKEDYKDALDFYHNSMLADIGAAQTTFSAQQAEAKQAAETELKKEWLDGYSDRVQRAQSVMEKYGGVGVVDELGLQNSVPMLKFLDNIAGAMSEDTLKGKGTPIVPTASNIKSQINDIRIEMDNIAKENPVNFKGNTKYKELTERKHVLYKQMPA